MNTIDHSAAHLAGWAEGNTELLAETGAVVVAVATGLISRHLDREEVDAVLALAS